MVRFFVFVNFSSSFVVAVFDLVHGLEAIVCLP